MGIDKLHCMKRLSFASSSNKIEMAIAKRSSVEDLAKLLIAKDPSFYVLQNFVKN